MNKTLLATTAFALVATHAAAVDVEMYGQVNKGLFAYDDGSDTDFFIGDNDLSNTRFGVKGAQVLDNGLTASILLEGEMASNSTDVQTQNLTPGQSTTPLSTGGSFEERQARVGLSGSFGGVYLGQQSTAIDGVLTQDLTGAQDVLTADYASIGGGLKVRNTDGSDTTFTVGELTSTLGQSRDDSVRYDSPILAGFQARASVAQGGDTEGSLFYDGAAGGFKLKGAAGVRFINSQPTGTTPDADLAYLGSVSALHASGVGATLGYTRLDQSGSDDAEAWYGKVGYSWDAYEVAADYGDSKDFAGAVGGDKLRAYGLGAQYNLGSGVSVAGLYRKFDSAVGTTSGEDIDLYGVNMRVKF
jgi:predicted porin